MNERIRKLRKELNLTLEKFGLKIGIKKNTLSQIETGKNNVTEQLIASIINADWDGKKVNESWLRDGTGEMFVELDVEDQLMDWAGKVLGGHDSKFKKRFVTMLMKLSEQEWELLEKKAKELADEADETEKGD